jgi:hypothetical protein
LFFTYINDIINRQQVLTACSNTVKTAEKQAAAAYEYKSGLLGNIIVQDKT